MKHICNRKFYQHNLLLRIPLNLNKCGHRIKIKKLKLIINIFLDKFLLFKIYLLKFTNNFYNYFQAYYFRKYYFFNSFQKL
jgi:hypothetical protein